MAVASTLMPGALAGALAQRVIGPMLCARLAGVIDPRKAVDTTKHLPPPFLADVAVQIDPRRAKDVIALVPSTLVAQVAGELVGRREYVTMGRFVGFLSDEAIRASMVEIDEESLLRVAFVLEGKERLDHVISVLPDERFPRLIGAAEEAGLWPEALDLLEHLGTAQKTRFADAVATLGADQRARVAEHARSLGVLDDLGPVGEAPEPSR
jgi:hypothetical protein